MATHKERLVSEKPAKPGLEPTLWVFKREVWRRDAGGVTSTRIDPDLEAECAQGEDESEGELEDDSAGYDRNAWADGRVPLTQH
jgi:hypothetical protein